jgi:hypothetical protein
MPIKERALRLDPVIHRLAIDPTQAKGMAQRMMTGYLRLSNWMANMR